MQPDLWLLRNCPTSRSAVRSDCGYIITCEVIFHHPSWWCKLGRNFGKSIFDEVDPENRDIFIVPVDNKPVRFRFRECCRLLLNQVHPATRVYRNEFSSGNAPACILLVSFYPPSRPERRSARVPFITPFSPEGA